MKKQNQKEIKPGLFSDMVSEHKMKEVAPPEGARRDALLNGKSAMTVKEATSTWFKTAKQQNQKEFLDVPSVDLKPTAAFDREMLYKGKKKSKE